MHCWVTGSAGSACFWPCRIRIHYSEVWTSDVDPDPELVGQIGSGPGIVIALNPALTFAIRKSENCCKSYGHLSKFVNWPGLNFKE
jgi:hypothetical protein